MIRRPPRSTRTDPLFPYTTLFRSGDIAVLQQHVGDLVADPADRVQRDARILEDHRHLAAADVAQHGFRRGQQVEAAETGGAGRHPPGRIEDAHHGIRSEEHTSELQSLMRISYAVFCLKKTKKTKKQ